MSEGVKLFKKPQIGGSKNPRWVGGEITTKDGRVMIYSPEHPRPSKGRYVYRYRLVVENRIGRFLLPSEIVHHKNGINNDDRDENLEVLDNKTHSRLHGEIMRLSWSRAHSKCVECGTTEQKHKAYGRCTRCNDRKRWPQRNK